jgi:DHA1 family bicyclomycin/chloramphenicol resistance-like MFS transporter
VIVFRETLPPSERRRGGLSATLRTFRTLVRERAFVGYVLCGAFGFSVMFAYIAGSSFVLQEIHGLSPQAYGALFGVNAIGLVATGQITGRLVGRVPVQRLLAFGLVQAAVGGVAVVIVTVAGLGLGALLPTLFVVVSSVGIIYPTSSALALSGHPSTAGSAAGLLGLAQFAIGGATAPIVGIAGVHTALPMAITIAVCGAMGLASFTLLTRPLPRMGPGVPPPPPLPSRR